MCSERLGSAPLASGMPPPSVVMPGMSAPGLLPMGFPGLTDAQRRGAVDEGDSGQSLASQENMQISGSEARNMVMQRLMRKPEVCHS